MKKKLLSILLSITLIATSFVNVVHADSKTVGELLNLADGGFPTTLEAAWIDGEGNSLYVSNDKLCIQLKGEQTPTEITGLSTTAEYTWAYRVNLDGGIQLTFYLDNETSTKLVQIEYYKSDPYLDINFGPSMTVEEFFGDSLNNFPNNFNDAWTNYYGTYIYATNEILGVYDSNNQLLDYVSLDDKTTPIAYYIFTHNGGCFDINFTGEGEIECVSWASSSEEFDFIYIYPRNKIRDILPENYPSDYSPWTNENDVMLIIGDINDFFCGFSITDYDSVYEGFEYGLRDMELTSGNNIYTSTNQGTNSENTVTFTFNLDSNGITESITIEGFTGDYIACNGTYIAPPPVYVSDLIAQSNNPFPTTKAKGWEDGCGNYAYVSNNKLIIDLVSGADDYVLLSEVATIDYGSFAYTSYHLTTNKGTDLYMDVNYGYFDTIAYFLTADDYTLFGPLTLATIMPEIFPYDNDTPPIDYWINENDAKLCLTSVNPTFKFTSADETLSFIPFNMPDSLSIERVNDNTYVGYDVVCKIEGGNYLPTEDTITYTFITNDDNILEKVKMVVTGEYSSLSGTYELPKTIAEILEKGEYAFPSSIDRAWENNGFGMYVDNAKIKLNNPSIEDLELGVFEYVKSDGTNYYYLDETTNRQITFNMNNEVLISISLSGIVGDLVDANGTYLPPDPIVYNVIDGLNEEIDVSKEEDIVFVSNADYSKFYDEVNDYLLGKVKVDGKLVKPNNYTHESGSTKITLNASYLGTLSNGIHTLRIISTDGYAETTFKITGNSTNPTNPTNSNKSKGYKVPNTGVK